MLSIIEVLLAIPVILLVVVAFIGSFLLFLDIIEKPMSLFQMLILSILVIATLASPIMLLIQVFNS